MMLKRFFATACALSALVSGAAVRTATPFADGMVLQRGRAVPVWGTAAPAKWRVDGNKVVLSFSDAKTLYYYNADISAPKGFEIAGEDGEYRAAKILNRLPSKWNRRGYVDGAELVLAADGVDSPRKVRYLASPPYVGSLYSSDSGLPLGPFEVAVWGAAFAGGYPHSPAALNDVKVTGGFWLPRIETNRIVTVKTDFLGDVE